MSTLLICFIIMPVGAYIYMTIYNLFFRKKSLIYKKKAKNIKMINFFSNM